MNVQEDPRNNKSIESGLRTTLKQSVQIELLLANMIPNAVVHHLYN